MDQTKDKPTKRGWRKVLRDAVLVLVVLNVAAFWQARSLVQSGTPAPLLKLPTLDGPETGLAPGKLTLVYFFAPWCGVCKVSAGNLAFIRWLVPPSVVEIKSVALAYDSVADVKQFVGDHGLAEAGPVALGDDHTIDAWRVSAFPTSYVVGADGAVKAATVGYSTTLGLLVRLLWARWT